MTLDELDHFALLAPGFVSPHEPGAPDAPWVLLEGLHQVDPAAPRRGPRLWLASAETPGRDARAFEAANTTFTDAPLKGETPGEALSVTLDARGALAAIESIRASIAAGDVYQVNFTLRARVACARASALLSALCHRGRPRFAAWVRVGGRELVSASPELLFHLDDRTLRVEPMKGTAKPFERASLETSEKDKAELAMITDLLRDDLHRLCTKGSVKVRQARRFIELPYALQTVSDIEGALRDGLTLRDVLEQLHPGGSVTGAPRGAALEHIRALEGSPRGLYCGALAYEDRRTTCSLLIRTAERLDGQTWQYGVGSGITWDSVAATELDEMRLKLGALGPNASVEIQR